MFRLHRLIRDFFGFSRAQVNAFLLLLPLMAIAIFSEPVYHWWISTRPRDFTRDRAMLDSMIRVWEKDIPDTSYDPMHRGFVGQRSVPAQGKEPARRNSGFFRFDPNTITEAEMTSLGFSAALSARIAHYRQKGGKFRVRADLRKMYGMDPAFYDAIYPYIKLPDSMSEKTAEKKLFAVEKKSKKNNLPFDLNVADTAQLKTIRGIGEKLSMRIIRYRDALGGFVSKDQVAEIYGLDSVVVNRLVKHSFLAENFNPRRININKATEWELSVHPYLSVSAAKGIVSYRFQHGDLGSVQDLRKIPALDDKTIQKITPYLEFRN